MNIQVNGESRQVPEGYTAARLVEDMGITGQRIAMEVNLEILPRDAYAQHAFHDGDRVEVVHAIGGG